jgi:hypothetical protein
MDVPARVDLKALNSGSGTAAPSRPTVPVIQIVAAGRRS